MKKKSLFKRLSSVALAFLLSLSALTQGITASAFCQHGAMISVVQVCQRAMILKQGNTMTHTSQATGQVPFRISQHLTEITHTVSTSISSIQAVQPLSSRHYLIM